MARGFAITHTEEMRKEEWLAAAGRGDLATVARAIARGQRLDAIDPTGATALLLAAEGGHLAVVQHLVTSGASLTAHRDEKVGWLARHAIDRHANARLRGRLTLLHVAGFGGHGALVAWLIDELGLEVNARDDEGRTPLHVAAASHHTLDSTSAVAALLARGADPNLADCLGQNALCLARAPSVPILLAAGADVDGGSALTASGRRPLETLVLANELAAVDCLLAHGASVTARALVAAARSFLREELLALLLARQPSDALLAEALQGPDEVSVLFLFARFVSLLGQVDGSVLLRAAELRHTTFILGALEKTDDLHARDARGRTALHHAADGGLTEAVLALLARGANPNLVDGDGKTPRALAWARGHEAVRRILEPVTAVIPAPVRDRGVGEVSGRVRHGKFGTGVVVAAEGDRVTVRFDEGGEKRLLVSALALA